MVRAGKKAEAWRLRLQRFQSSGLSVSQFCAREQVSQPSFYQWRKRLQLAPTRPSAPTFLPVRLTQSAAVEIHLPNGARVSVPSGNAEALRVAIEAAGAVDHGGRAEAAAC
jgi:hypothetical protein